VSRDFLVFVVDDDPIILEIIQSVLSDVFAVETFTNAKSCLTRIQSTQPSMLLLDVNMPEMDGLALCRHLKDDFETNHIPIVFISASDDIATRLGCYDAGGSDFVHKPFEPVELHRKISITQQRLTEKAAIAEQASFAHHAAMSAMTSVGELGVVLQFLSKSFTCDSPLDLSNAILESLNQYQLQGAIQVRLAKQEISVSHNGLNNPLEVSVLNHVRNSGRIFQFKTRCVFNYGAITLMINNMPIEDADRCGRIRDNVAILAEGAAARLQNIEIDQSNRRRQKGIEEALPQVHNALDKVQTNYRRNCFELTEVMIEYQEMLVKSFVHLGLSQDQENFISNLAHTYMEKMVVNQDQSLAIVGDLEVMASTLEKLTTS
jgi:CheY-like chemotaxis protein